MKYTFIFTLILILVGIAYNSAQNKMMHSADLHGLRLGMTLENLQETYGTPSAKNRNRLTYIFDDYSELIVTFRDDVVSSAQLKFHRPIKIEDPKMRQLTLVQMQSDIDNLERPSWFFAGKPEEGLIYKITSEGVIESITWVPPFSYTNNQPKRLQALLQDFKGQHWSKL